MQALSTGLHLRQARERLDLTQAVLADVLGIGISTLQKYERAERIDALVSLAVECLLRRETMKRQAPKTPAERAAARLEERRLYKQMVADAGLKRTPEEVAARQVAIAAERRRLRAETSPEEIAARQVAIAVERQRLKEEAGLVATPADRAAVALTYREERRRIGLLRARNRERERERPLIADLQRRLRPLYAASAWNGDWVPYLRAVDLACQALGSDPAPYQSAYLEASRTGVLDDLHPLVTLPPEVE